VIANAAGALDFVRDRHNGIFFEYGDHASLAQALEHMLALQAEWPKMGGCARETVVAQADLPHIAAMIAQLYI
jgi:glycosyltransferase involved in cell wall biosynthesis